MAHRDSEPRTPASAGHGCDLRDFWVVYDRHYDEILAATLRAAEVHPEFGPLMRAMPADELAARNARSRELLRRAVDGDREEYEADLRLKGRTYADLGVSFSGWYDVVRVFERHLVPKLLDAYADSPARLSAALSSMKDFLDEAMAIIGEEYLLAKERKIAEQREVAEERARELARSEVRKAAILETALDGIITMDHTGCIVEFNPAAERTFGQSREAVIGRSVAEVVIPPALRAAHRAGLQRYLETGEGPVIGKRLQLPALRADGTELVAEISICRNPADDPPTFTAFIRDVTESQRAHEALRASEERYRLLFENSPLPMWVYDVETLAFLAVNDAAVRHYGHAREEFLRMTIKDIRPAEDVPLMLASVKQMDAVQGPRRWRHRKKDGAIIIVEISSHDFALDGRPARLVLATDITARERAEEELRKSEARFARLLEAGILGIVIADTMGNIKEANDAFLRILGYSRADLAGGRIPGAELSPKEWAAADAAAGEQLRAHGVARAWEKEFFRKDGSRVPVVVGVAMLEPPECVAFVLDITERKRLEQVRRDAAALEAQNSRIKEANRLKSEFLANMSHELRTPLNAILGFGELLYDGAVPPDSPEHREFLGDILKSGRHLLQLINDVLDLAKVEAGKLDFRPEPIDLELLIGEVAGIVRAIAISKRIRTGVIVDPALREGILLDPARLKQIVYNFLSNALKFTPLGGSVEVRALSEGSSAFRIEVEDTGPGIAPEDIGKLFIEFQQLDAGAARQHAGTGLGLALTRRLAEAQGGSVGVRSAPGGGSVFHAILPRRSPIGPAQQPRPRAAPRPGAPSVLVIEDDQQDHAMLEEALSGAGYAVEIAGTGAQALALAGSRRFDAITLDLLLPDISGQDVLARIRASGPNRDVPVIVVTIVAEKGAVAGFRVSDFLPKPIDAGVLLASLRRAGLQPEQPGSVLVIDDDPGSLKVMDAALAQLGYRTICLTDAEEALRMSERAPPKAVVLDLLMPALNGFEFLERFRGSPANLRTPVLIWTVKDLNAEEHARLRSSAQGIVRKGEGMAALLEDLRRFLATESARKEL